MKHKYEISFWRIFFTIMKIFTVHISLIESTNNPTSSPTSSPLFSNYVDPKLLTPLSITFTTQRDLSSQVRILNSFIPGVYVKPGNFSDFDISEALANLDLRFFPRIELTLFYDPLAQYFGFCKTVKLVSEYNSTLSFNSSFTTNDTNIASSSSTTSNHNKIKIK